jgi:hypothetical protein
MEWLINEIHLIDKSKVSGVRPQARRVRPTRGVGKCLSPYFY